MKSITRFRLLKWPALAFLLIPICHLFPQYNNITSGHYTIDNGLSQSSINCIAQDKIGFMWFGTQDGLNRFDGYSFTVFKHISDNNSSLSDNSILNLLVDRSGVLWIATESGGLDQFNYETETFTSFKYNPKDLKSISSDHVNSISEDPSGNLWIGTNRGLDYLNKKDYTFIRFSHNDQNSNSLSSDTVHFTYIDHNGKLWIGTENGLNFYDQSTKKFFHYLHNPRNINSISSNKINSISQGNDGSLWIGTVDAGLNKLNIKTNEFIHYRNLKDNANSLGSDSVEAVYSDRDGTVWIGCLTGGLNEFSPQTKSFYHYLSDLNNPNSIDDYQVLSIFQDKEGIVWIGSFTSGVFKLNKMKRQFGAVSKETNYSNGLNDNDVNSFSEDQFGNLLIGTNNGGLNVFNKKNGRFIHYVNNKSENSLMNNSVVSLYVDKNGIIWIGTTVGLDKFNQNTKTFEHFVRDPKNPSTLGYPYINSIISDGAGNLWLGLWGGGLDKLTPNNKFIHYKHDPKNPNSLCNDNVTFLYLDKKGIIWIGTNGGGLDRFNPKSGSFFHYTHNPNDKNSLNQNYIYLIYQFPNDDNYLWIGTAGGGLNKLDLKTDRFTYYTEDDGLANNIVYGILGDKNGNLWLSTNKGLSKFNPNTKVFKNYDQSFGLQSNEFNQDAFFENKNGEMFFGGIKGFNMFYPENIKDNLFKPPVVITSFKKFNKDVKLSRAIFLTDTLILSNKDYVLSFTFASLSYTNPDNNLYSYKLEGFDKDWIELGRNNSATFTNLNPGRYILRIKASNNDGVWNERGASLTIIITPPFWLTWWFKIIFSVSIILIIFILYKWRIKNIRNQNKKLEAIVSERTQELELKTKELVKYNKMQGQILEQLSQSEIELKELNAAKDKYFSILAHDLRSPFNSLVGFSDLLENEFDNLDKEDIKKAAKNINISAKNLLKLINTLLEWSMFQAGKMEYNPSQENLTEIVNQVIDVLHGNAQKKSISLQNEINSDISVWADKYMLHSIFQNLISNSIKFTSNNGSIKIIAIEDDAFIQISVCDTGVGISKEDINKLFDLNKLHSTRGTGNESGSGLGLNLCKELVKKQGGEISVKSELGKGTTFIFTLPKNK